VAAISEERRKTMAFDYFYGKEDAEQYLFYRIPKTLITGEEFREVSVESKLLYGLMLDRLSLSMKNRWFDDLNRAYIIYTIEDIMTDLHCGNQKAVKLLSELEKKAGLIKRKRQGLGKPSLIYVLKFSTSNPQNTSESHFKKCENHTSGDVKITSLEMCESHSNKTYINETEYNENNPINLSHSEPSEEELDRTDEMDENTYPLRTRKQYEDYFLAKLEIDPLKEAYPFDHGRIDEIVAACVDIMCSNSKTIRVNGEDKPAAVVKSQIMKLDYSHMEYILDCFHDQTSDIRNIRAYMMTMLYNAPLTINHYYQAKVNHDMYGPPDD
jgi:hypothetical protein